MGMGHMFGRTELIILGASSLTQYLEMASTNGKLTRTKSRPHGQYHGELEKGYRHGKGKFAKGEYLYEGDWKNGKVNGYGTLYFDSSKSCYYKGEWMDGKKHGNGIMIYKSGNSYEGQWSDNIRHGKGRMIWKNRDEEYNGEWVVSLFELIFRMENLMVMEFILGALRL